MEALKQTREIGVAGGFFNQLMGNNQTVPKVGEGATHLMYSDRHAYEVISVDEENLSCVIDQYKPKRIDKLGMSDSQIYEYKELYGNPKTLVWRKKKGGCWCEHNKVVSVIPKVIKDLNSKSNKFSYWEQIREVYGQDVYDQVCGRTENGDWKVNVVEGITKEYDSYHPISIIFGTKEEYYDFSF